MYRFVLLLCCLGIGIGGTSCTPSSTSSRQTLPEQVDFNFHIKPILSDRCFNCHGPDENTRKAGLRLDTEEGAFALREDSTFAIVPGDVAHSLLIQRITHADPEERMPPLGSNLSLSDDEIALLGPLD